MKIKILIFLLSIFAIGIIFAGTSSEQLVKTDVATLATYSSQTFTISDFTLDGDSIGLNINFNKDSVSGQIYYVWVTQDGNAYGSMNTLTLADGSTTFSNVGSQKTVFTYSINRVAGVSRAYVYVKMTNMKKETATATITSKVYKVTWR